MSDSVTTGDSAEPQRRVLILDDESYICRLLVRLLGRQYDVTTETSDPAPVLARIRDGERFDVILCDLTMSGMAAPSVYSALTEIDQAQADRLVILTGGVTLEAHVAFLEDVMPPMMEKPFDLQKLRALVAEVANGG